MIACWRWRPAIRWPIHQRTRLATPFRNQKVSFWYPINSLPLLNDWKVDIHAVSPRFFWLFFGRAVLAARVLSRRQIIETAVPSRWQHIDK